MSDSMAGTGPRSKRKRRALAIAFWLSVGLAGMDARRTMRALPS